MRARLNTLLLLVAILCSGCAALEVEVSILERSVVDELVAEDRVKDALPIIRAETDPVVTALVTQISNAHHSVYVNTSNAIFDEINTLCGANDNCDNGLTDALRNAVTPIAGIVDAHCSACTDDNKSVFNELANAAFSLQRGQSGVDYPAFTRDWSTINGAIRTLATQRDEATEEDQRRSFREQILAKLNERNATLGNYYTQIGIDLDLDSEQAGSTNAQIQRVAALLHNDRVSRVFQASVGAVVTSTQLVQLFDSGGFEHSKYASVVVGAGEEHWIQQPFDTAQGGGYFGNVDVAIKALGPTNFTIKGLTFNPSDVAVAASKVTTQAVLLAAQISGVPVNVQGTPTGDGAALAKSSTALQTVRNNVVQAETQLASFDNALTVIAEAILDEADGVQSGDDARLKESLRVIQAIYTSQQSRLGISSGGNQSGDSQ